MLAAMQYSYPLLTESGVSPFHQPGAGRVVLTVRAPAVSGDRWNSPWCPETGQSP